MNLGFLDDFLDRPNNQKIAILVGVFLMILVLDWQYVYGPRRDMLNDLDSKAADLRAEVQVKSQRANARAEAERQLRELNAQLKEAAARLPDQREIADLLSSIASSGRSAGLDIVLFRQKPEGYHDFYADVPVQMEMRGTYHDVVTFLDRVRRLDRIVNVTDIGLRKPQIEGERVLLTASCTATTFRFLDDEERKRVAEEKKKQQGQQQRKKGNAA